MNRIIITIATLAFVSLQAMAQEHGRGDTVLSSGAFEDGVTTIDALNIDAEINISGAVFTQRNATGDIATITLNNLDAAAVALTHKVDIKGETVIGDEARLSEGNLYLAGDLGSVDINTQYQRQGKIALGTRATLNLANITIK